MSESETIITISAFISQLEREDLNGKLLLMSKLSSDVEEACSCKQWKVLANHYQLFCHVFLSSESKNPLKQYAARSLMKFPLQYRSDIRKCLCEDLVDLMKPNGAFSQKHILSKISDCFENFPIGVDAVSLCLEEVLYYICLCLRSTLENMREDLSPMEQNELIAIAHHALRDAVMVLQKFLSRIKTFIEKNYSKETKCLKDTLCASVGLINHELIPLDSKLNCGLVIGVLCSTVCTDGQKVVLNKLTSDDSVSRDVDILKDIHFKTKVAQMSMCYGLINIMAVEDLCAYDQNRKKYFIDGIFRTLVALSESTDNNLCLGCSRALQQAVHILHNATVKKSCSESIEMLANTDILSVCLAFVWVALDHYVDCVRHAAKTMLQELVQIADFMHSKGKCDVSLEDVIIGAVGKIPSYKKSKYIALTVLANEFGYRKLKSTFPNLISTLLEVLEDPSMSSHVSNAYESLMLKSFKEEDEAQWINTWIFPVFNAYSKSKACYILESVITKAMKLHPSLLHHALSSMEGDLTESSRLRIAIVCLKIGAKLGILSKMYAQYDTSQRWKGIIKYDNIMLGVVNHDDEIRLSALSLVVECNKTTQSFDVLELELIKYFLWYNINSDNAALKQKNLMLQKKVLTRIKESAYPLMKILKSKEETDPQVINAKEILLSYSGFLKWLYIFCFKCLFPGANAARRASALEILVYIEETFIPIKEVMLNDDKWDPFLFKRQNEFAELLFTCLKDSFESNKLLAVNVLMKFPAEALGLKDQLQLHEFLNVGLKMASSVKPPDCITAAYLLNVIVSYPEAELFLSGEASKVTSELLPDFSGVTEDGLFHQKSTFCMIWILFDQLKKQLEVGKQNLLLAAGSGPMYGTLFSIRHLLKNVDFNAAAENPAWKSLVLELVSVCFEVNDAVIHIVNSSSPEGHLPMDFEPATHHGELNSLSSPSLDSEDKNPEIFIQKPPVTAQMVLLCSWRTVKEVSLFLGEVSFQAPIQIETPHADIESHLLTEDLVLNIGDHFTKLLSETKHRGAFEQAYVGFCQLCKKLWKHPSGILSSLPKMWLKDIFNEINKGKKSTKLCATRRSAGVPFIVQALVTTELDVRQPTSLKEAMEILLGLLENKDTESGCGSDRGTEVESRTHAMNILRAMFRHTLLGELVTPYVSRGIMAAIMGFKGNTWAERNSATLLFGALIIRIFGVKHSREDTHRRNRMTGRVFFERFPSLYDFILGELKEASAVAIPLIDLVCGQISGPCLHPSLFPLLVILSRLYPSSLEGTDSNMQLSAFVPPLKSCLKSKIYKIRELAARAMVPLITSNMYIFHIDEAFRDIAEDTTDQNCLHGVLLQISFLLLEVPYPKEETEECLGKKFDFWIRSSIKILTVSQEFSFMVKEAYIRVLRHLLFISSSSFYSFPKESWDNVFHVLIKQIKQYNASKDASAYLVVNLGGQAWIHRAMQILLEIAVISNISSESLIELLCSVLMDPCPVECVTVALSFMSSVFGEEGCECDEEEDGLPLFHWPKIGDWSTKVLHYRTHFILDQSLALAVVHFLLRGPNFSFVMQKALRVVGYLAPATLNILWQKKMSTELYETINPFLYMVELCQSQPENVGRAAFCCLAALVHEATGSPKEGCLAMDFGAVYCDLLLEFSLPDKSEQSRIIVAEALVNHHTLLCQQVFSFTSWDQCRAWVVLFDLLGDHSRPIRQTVAKICKMFTFSEELKTMLATPSGIPTSRPKNEVANQVFELDSDWKVPTELIMDHFCDVMPEYLKELLTLYFGRKLGSTNKYECVITLLALILRDNCCEESEDTANEERVFDKAEVNLYSEWLTHARICASLLVEILYDASLLEFNQPIPSSVMTLVGLQDFPSSSVLDFITAAVLNIMEKIDSYQKAYGMNFSPFLTPGYDTIQKEAFKVSFLLNSLKNCSTEILECYVNFSKKLADTRLLKLFPVFCD